MTSRRTAGRRQLPTILSFVLSFFVVAGLSASGSECIWVPLPTETVEVGFEVRGGSGAPVAVTCSQRGGCEVRRHGQLLVVARPTADGGVVLRPLTGSPTYVKPRGDGRYAIERASEPTLCVTPTRDGGYTVSAPGQAATVLRHRWNGGYVIVPPHGPSLKVELAWGSTEPDVAPVPVPVVLSAEESGR